MERADPLERIVLYNQLVKELDELYHMVAVHSQLSDTAFWILYSICEREEAYTQKELCEAWSYSRQTVNSALKVLKEKGLVQLIPIPDNHKNKQIFLTPAGETLAAEVILPLMKAEKNSFLGLEPNEQALFLSLTQKYLDGLRRALCPLFHTSSEDCASQCTKG